MASGEPITRKDLWESRGNIKFKDWEIAAKRLGLPLTRPTKGSSHLAIRKPETKANQPLGLDSLVATIYGGMSKVVNGYVFRQILAETSVTEDELWRALGRLK
jgi:hypothetical protein